MVGLPGLEPGTCGLKARCSALLSYKPVIGLHGRTRTCIFGIRNPGPCPLGYVEIELEIELEPEAGIEPATSSLPRRRSAN